MEGNQVTLAKSLLFSKVQFLSEVRTESGEPSQSRQHRDRAGLPAEGLGGGTEQPCPNSDNTHWPQPNPSLLQGLY